MCQRLERLTTLVQYPGAQHVVHGGSKNQYHQSGKQTGNHGEYRQLRQGFRVGQPAAEEIQGDFFWYAQGPTRRARVRDW